MGDALRPYAAGDLLCEREGELGSLAALIAQSGTGAGQVALVEGPAGIGKTRLLAEARVGAATAGFRVLTARAAELEAAFPFGVVRQLYEAALADPALRREWLTGSAGAAAPVFTTLGDAAASHGDVSFTVLHGLYWLTLNAAASGPLLLSVDDIHWCDRPSLRFIAYLARRVAGLPVLLALGLRSAERGANPVLLGEIADSATAQIRPAPLSEAAVGELVSQRLNRPAEPSFSAACHEATGGNPLLLHELTRALGDEGVIPDAAHARVIKDIGPSAVSHSVLLRLMRLSTEAIMVARAVAALGDGATLPTIAALTGLPESSVTVATRALVRSEILRPEPPLGFVHPLVHDAVYRELTPSERELLHRQAAEMLRDAGASAEQVAAQLLVIPRLTQPWAAEMLRAAGRTASQQGAAESAVSYLRRALDEPVSDDVRRQLLFDLGLAEALVSAPAAAEHLRAAYDELTDPVTRAQVAGMLARMLIFTRPPGEAVIVAREAAAYLPPELADLRLGLEAMELYGASFGAPGTDGKARLERTRAGVEPTGPGALMLTAVAAWDWALNGGTAADCAALALESLAGGALISADPAFMTVVAIGVLVLADRDEALDSWEATLAEAYRQGSLFAVSGVHLWRGWTWLQRGELAEAEESLRQAVEDTKLWNSEEAAGMPYAAAFLARTLLERGDIADASFALAHSGHPYPNSDGDGLCRRSRIELLLAQRQWQAAAEEADEYAARLRGVVNPAWAPWRSLKAEALGFLGRRDEAVSLAEEELAWARRWAAPGAVGRALRVLGTLQRGDGLDALREAAEVTAASPARLEHAKALVELGSGLRQARQVTDARHALRLGLELALRCAAGPLAERARADLYAAGGRPGRPTFTGVESLTPSERRIADLAAVGRSNREIAEELYVTPKTVEVHLSNAYRKLGIRSRSGLAAALSASAG